MIITKEEYKAHPAINNSLLRWILPEDGGSPKKFENKVLFPEELSEDDSAQKTLGTLAHKMVELKGDLDQFEVVEKPSPAVAAICEEVVAHPAFSSMTPVQMGEEILRVARAAEFQPKWKDDTIVKHIGDYGAKYMTALSSSTNVLVSESQMNDLKNIRSSIDEKLPWLFDESKLEKGVKVLRETPIIFSLKYPNFEVECKALIDIMVIDDTKKSISIFDLKTTSTPLSIYIGYSMQAVKGTDTYEETVEGLIWKYKVGRQMSFYQLAASNEYPMYQVKSPYIIACETKGIYECEVFQVPYDKLESGSLRIDHGMGLLYTYDLLNMGGL